MLQLLFLLGGSLLLAAGLFGGSGNAAKARKRRMEGLKERHAGGNPVETQLRRIAAQRATRLDTSLNRLIPNPDLLRRRLQSTGRSWTLTGYAMTCGGIAFAAMVALWWRGAPLLLALLLGILAGIGLPHLFVGKLIKKRVQKFLLRFPDAIELLVRGLRSGLPISETLTVVGTEIPDPVGTEFRQVSDKMRIGRTMEGALQDTADRLDTAEFQFFVITLAIQSETGGNLAETLGNLADVLRKRLQMKLKIRAMSSESKASAYIIGVLPFLVFGAIMYLNPEYGSKFFSDTRLMIAGCGGGVWMGIGALVMAKMINFEI
jgi:tight adherence protein B